VNARRKSYRFLVPLATENPDEMVFGEVKVYGKTTTITMVFRRGDVMYLVSGCATGKMVNYFSSIDSTTPDGQVLDRLIMTVHIVKQLEANQR